MNKYCPLCGAHEFEWNEGETDEETVLRFKEEIKKLYRKMEETGLTEEDRMNLEVKW